MKRSQISRRRFARIAGTAASAGLCLKGAGAPTAKSVVQRLQSALGGEWPAGGRDGFKAGDPNSPVTGIATTAMATMDVLRQAAKIGANLIVAYEPAFFGREDGPSAPTPDSGQGARRAGFRGLSADDPVYRAKKDFIEKNRLVIFRLHDNWLARNESAMTAGLAESLGWGNDRVGADDALYEVAMASAEEIVALIRAKLNLRGGLRAVGDRTAQVRRVLLFPGVMSAAAMWERYTEADLTVAGEVREWENTFYAADMYTAGEKRALVTVGRVASEDPGMRACARWLDSVIEEVPVRWIPAGDLYWRAS